MVIKMIIAIDGGTTNTRLTLVDKSVILDRIKKKVGARSGSPELRIAVREGIAELLAKNPGAVGKASKIVLSGMIGSESGLCEIPHIVAPAGVEELRKSLVTVKMPDVTELPLVFIPGVKTFSDPGKKPLCELDIMRGEETELCGIMSEIGARKATVLLPGSHMKIIETDCEGRIISFRTSISGELSRAAAENTILSRSIGGVFPASMDAEYLKKGFEYAKKYGIGEALFKVRVQGNFLGVDPEKLYAFLLGAVLKDDVMSLRPDGDPVVIAGSEPFRSALDVLIQGEKIIIDDKTSETAAALGAELIAGE